MRHLTFTDLAQLHDAGYRRLQWPGDALGINRSNDDHYTFEWYPSHIPGEDRLVRLSFCRDESDEAWWVEIIDRDDDGEPYHEVSWEAGDDLHAALTWAASQPWAPSPKRLAALLHNTTGTLTCQQGVLTFPDGTHVRLPPQETLK